MERSIIIENIGGRDELKKVVAEAIKEHFGTPKTNEDRYLTRQEARAKLRICLPTLDKALKEGELIGYRIGGKILLKDSEIKLSTKKRR
ncbi:MAG TPA: hypothetical protein VIK14_15300 [Ignavibacteria bacterium]